MNVIFDSLICKYNVSFLMVWHISKSLFCLESGKIENHLLPYNTLLKKLAFAICLHGKAAVTLQDINVSLPYKCSSCSGCLFSKVEPRLPKQNSIWIIALAFPHRGVYDACTGLHFLTVLFDCTITLVVPCFIILLEMWLCA